jgi:hypothetical protein
MVEKEVVEEDVLMSGGDKWCCGVIVTFVCKGGKWLGILRKWLCVIMMKV